MLLCRLAPHRQIAVLHKSLITGIAVHVLEDFGLSWHTMLSKHDAHRHLLGTEEDANFLCGVALVAEPSNYDSWSSFLRWQLFGCIVDSVKGDRFARQPKQLPAEEGLLTCNLQLSHHCWVQPQTPRSTKEICVFLCGWVGG